MHYTTVRFKKDHHFLLNFHHLWQLICFLRASLIVGSKRELLYRPESSLTIFGTIVQIAVLIIAE
jgi:hypothetical protein